MSFLRYVPPMGIYETLYAFRDAFGTYMGEPGTHPWSQGFPRTVQLPGGPEMPTSVRINSTDLKYPKAWGLPALRVYYFLCPVYPVRVFCFLRASLRGSASTQYYFGNDR